MSPTSSILNSRFLLKLCLCVAALVMMWAGLWAGAESQMATIQMQPRDADRHYAPDPNLRSESSDPFAFPMLTRSSGGDRRSRLLSIAFESGVLRNERYRPYIENSGVPNTEGGYFAQATPTPTPSGTPTCFSPPSGLVTWWPFEETGINAAVPVRTTRDIVSGRDGTIQPGPLNSPGSPSSVTGKVGNAFDFNGSTAFVQVPDGPGTLSFGSPTDNFTIDAWIKVQAQDKAGVRAIVDKRLIQNNMVFGYEFFLFDGNLGFQMANGAGSCDFNAVIPDQSCTNYLSPANVADGQWHHVTVTVQRTGTPPQVTLYDNCSPVLTDKPRPGNAFNIADLLIGSGYSPNPLLMPKPYFKGQIDELEIFNRALTQPEIQSICMAGSSGKCKVAVISGQVKDVSGAPIGDVTMSLSGSSTATSTTDTSGNYSFTGLELGGNYTVTPAKSGFNFTPLSQTFNNLTANQTANFTGAPIFTISGRVADASNNGLSGVMMSLTGSTTNTRITDAGGNYSFTGLGPGGNYTVTPAKSGFTFTPESRTFNNLSANQTANFIGTSADLAVTQTAAPDVATVGDNVTYTINVTNNGPDPATGVSVLDSLPDGSTFVSASSGCSRSGSSITCSLQTLAVGGAATLNVVVKAKFAGTITNVVRVQATEGDPNLDNNIASQTTIINPLIVPVDANLNFEAGDFRGWTVENNCGAGSWFVYSGATSPLNNHPIDPPPEGSFAALTDQPGPGTHILYRDFTLASAQALSFVLYYQNLPGDFATPPTLDCSLTAINQQYRVDIMDPNAPVNSVAAGDVLKNLFQTKVGDAPTKGPTTITSDLTPFAGRTVRLRFAEVDNQSYFNAGVDDVRLTSLFTISGQVSDNNKKPLSGVTMSLSGSATATTTTDANGNYSFTSLGSGGNYTVAPSKSGCNFTPLSQTFNNLSANQTANFTCAPIFTISGRVADPSNNPLSGVTMSLSGSATDTRITDADGNYSFTGLGLCGTYTVTPTKSAFTFTPPSQTFNDLSANQTADFTARPFITITGRVTSNTNNGIAGVNVTLSGPLTRVAQTDANGAYSFTNLPGGTDYSYSVMASSRLFVFNPPRFDFPSLSANQIANFVRVPNATPTPTPDLSDNFNATPMRDPMKWNFGTATQPAGAFDPQVSVVQTNGKLFITPRSNVSGPHYNGYVSVNAFDLSGGGAVGLEIDRPASGGADTIFAIGTDSDNFFRFMVHTPVVRTAFCAGTGVDPLPPFLLFQVQVAGQLNTLPIPYDPVQHRFMRFRFDAVANTMNFETSPDNINYTVRLQSIVTVGIRNLTAELSAGTSSAIPASAGTSSATLADPAPAILDNFSILPDPLGLSILGHVEDVNGVPIGGVTMTLSGSTNFVAITAIALTDADGNYSFTRLLGLGGNYTVTPAKNCFDFTPASQTFNNFSANQTANFTGAPTTTTFTISGQVADAGMNGLAGVTMSLSGSATATTTTDQNGNYAFPGLGCGGNYTVTPSKSGLGFTPASQPFNNLSTNQTANFTGELIGFTIGGRVADSSNNGLSGVTISLSGSANDTGVTDASGHYLFGGLVVGGTYKVIPSKNGFGFSPPSQTFNNLSAPQTADFTARPFISITGRVTDNSSNGIAGVNVTLSGALTRVAQTDANGAYSFTNLLGGTDYSYSVIASSRLFVFNPPRFDFTSLSANQIANFVQMPNATPTPTPDLGDRFDDPTRDPTKWNFGTATQPAGAFDPQVSVAQTNGKLVITPRSNVSGPHYNGYVSVNAFDLTGGGAVGLEIDQAASGGADTIFAIGTDSDNFFRFTIHTPGAPIMLGTIKSSDGIEQPFDSGTLLFQVNIAGQLSTLPLGYDPVKDLFMRFRFDVDADTLNFETSPDNVKYTVRVRIQVLKDLTTVSALTAELSAGTSSAIPASAGTSSATLANPAPAILDNFSFVRGTNPAGAASYSVDEGNSRIITITRAGVASTGVENLNPYNAELEPGFVLMRYFGYFRRNPGYNLWLNKLNFFDSDSIRAEVMKGLIAVPDYRQRFGP